MDRSEKRLIDELLTVDEVSRILKISRKSIYNQITRKNKKFPIKCYRMGKGVRFRASEVQEFITSLQEVGDEQS